MRRFTLIVILCIPLLSVAQQKGHIKAGALNIYYQSTGTGNPLLLLHAGFQDMRMWEQQVSYFSPNWRVITIDLPGHGNSKGTDTVTLIADILRIVMDSLQLQQASVAGLSLGAACALDLALAYPQRVNKLVLCSPGLSGWPDVMKMDTLSQQLFQHTDSIMSSNNDKAIAENFTRLWYDGPFRKPDEVDVNGRNYILYTTLKTIQQSKHTWPWPVFDKQGAAKRLDSLAIPVLIVAGSLDVPFILDAARYIHQQVTTSMLQILSNVAHMINMEKPDDFNVRLSNFLETQQPL
ncbi:MAG: alpha/beta hydrolase [Chitinophagaceae bacterium]